MVSPVVENGRPPTIALYRRLGQLGSDPLPVLQEIAREHGDRLVRLNLGLFKPYLVTRPDQVEHVWKHSDEIYQRSGMMWDASQRLQGRDGIGAEGPGWKASRKIIQPMFTGRSVSALIPGMVDAINEAVDDLAARVGDGATLSVTEEMMRITHRVLGRVLLGDRISPGDADTVGMEITTAFSSMKFRLALPFVSHHIPLPGDRRFHQATRAVDAILKPHIERARAEDARESDVVSLLAHARDEHGEPIDIQKVRNDVVGLFIGGTETTATTLVWLWVILDLYPDIDATMREEIDRTVGRGPVAAEHIPGLGYCLRVLEESLRLYPPAWMIPRTLQRPDVLGGVRLGAGDTVVLSPYLTHRMPHLWDDPERFDPERFTPEAQRGRHKFAFYPFGGGIHRCIGSYFFEVESALAVAALLSRFRVKLHTAHPIRPQVSLALRPKQQVIVELRPR